MWYIVENKRRKTMKTPITDTWTDDCFDNFVDSLKENREDIIAMLHKRTRKCTIKFVLTPGEVPYWVFETEHNVFKIQKASETNTELRKDIK